MTVEDKEFETQSTVSQQSEKTTSFTLNKVELNPKAEVMRNTYSRDPEDNSVHADEITVEECRHESDNEIDENDEEIILMDSCTEDENESEYESENEIANADELSQNVCVICLYISWIYSNKSP